jgi:REP element-mobilizing transposase RayT
LTQLVTFRLADSFPQSLHAEWEHLWKIEDDRLRRYQLEQYLDKGRGSAWLKRPEVAAIAEDAVRFFQREWYELKAWVIMPNHVHVLFEQKVSLRKILESWKKHSAGKINKFLGRSGRFWQRDYWDTYMRDPDQELKARGYIENNPIKATLVTETGLCPGAAPDSGTSPARSTRDKASISRSARARSASVCGSTTRSTSPWREPQ